ncbi:hypothetical protein BN129_4247 [Cronobacter sakazakii 701]|nr:hypothetical protein BN129_4247 [Cronobacter sakazakii 701]
MAGASSLTAAGPRCGWRCRFILFCFGRSLRALQLTARL